MLARMAICVKTCRLLLWGTLLLCLGVGAVAAEPVDERELSRWVPSFALLTGMNAQRTEGGLLTGDVLGPQHATAEPQILSDTPPNPHARMMTPFVGGSIELMTPAWVSLPGRPRAYSHVDISFGFGPEYRIPKIRDPGSFRNSPGSVSFTEGTILGQGGQTAAEVEPLLVAAGAGFAFTLEAWDRALRIKPSLEYLREEIEIRGVVRRVVIQQTPAGSVNPPDFRHITLTAKKTQVYHGLGPGIELELDARRSGPFVLSLFIGAKAWAFLDNEKQVVIATNEFGEHAVFEFLKNRWAFAGSLGLRFRWVPE